MQVAGGIKNRKRRQQKLEDVLTKTEAETKITAIQSLDLEEFVALVATIDQQTAPLVKQRLEDTLQSHFKQIQALPKETKEKQFTDILSFRELVRNYRKVVSKDDITEDLREPLYKIIQDYDKKINKVVDQVISDRERAQQEDILDRQNFIGIAVLNIKEKILNYATPTDTTALNNLQRTLNSLVIGIKARMEDLDRSDVIRYEQEGKVFVKGPSPAKFFERENLQIDRTIAEHQINNIQDLYLFFHELKRIIRNLPNIKRNFTNTNLRKNTGKYASVSWEKMLKEFDDVVNNSSLEMAQIMIKNIPKLLKQNIESSASLANIYSEPYLDQKFMLYVYDALDEITFECLRTYNKMYEGAYKLLINSLYIKWIEGVFPLLSGTRAEKLLLINAVNRLFQLEDKMDVKFILIKQKMAQNPIMSQMVRDKQQNIKIVDKLLAQDKPVQKTVEAVNMALDDILQSMEVKQQVVVKAENPKATKEEYEAFMNSLKDNNNYKKLQNEIIKHYYAKYGTKLDLSFYKNMQKEEYQTRYLLHTSGFFNMYASVYGHYGRDIFRDIGEQNNAFHLWRATRIDSGHLIAVYKKFLTMMINRGFVLFRKERLEARSLSKDEEAVKASFFQDVNTAYDDVIKMNEKVKVVMEKTTGVCEHILVEDELNRVYDLLEQEPENSLLKDELNELLHKKNACTIESESAIICKHCNVQLDVIISSEPSSFDDAQDVIAEHQQQLMFDIEQMREEMINESNQKIIAKYLDLYVKVLQLEVVDEVSAFDDHAAVSKDQLNIIAEQVNKIMINSDKVIYNNARSFFTKNSKVRADTMKNQLIHDLIKFLIVLFLLQHVENKENLPCKEHVDNPIAYVQCLYQYVQSSQAYLDKSTLSKEVRLNYVIRVYNLAIDLLKTVQSVPYEKDNNIITEESIEKLSDDKIIIISQEFGVKTRNIGELKKIVAKSSAAEIELPMDWKSVGKKLYESLEKSYEAILRNLDRAVFKKVEVEDVVNALEQYILLSEKQENLRMQLKQNNFNVKDINKQINDLNMEIAKSSTPSEKLFLEQRRQGLENMLAQHEKDKIELSSKTKQLKADQDHVDMMEPTISAYAFPRTGINPLNLYQYAQYMSRAENRDNINPHFDSYNKAHKDVMLYEKLSKMFPNIDYRLVKKYIRQMFMDRYNLITDARNNLEFLVQLKKLASVVDGRGTLSSIVVASEKKNFIYESELGVVSLEHSFFRNMKNNLNVSALQMSYSALNSLVNSAAFIDMIRNKITFDITDALAQVEAELKSYGAMMHYFEKLADVIYLCPVCDRSDTHNVNVKHHLSTHHISTNDNLRTIRPLIYTSEMDWFKGESNYEKGYICPYCPYRAEHKQLYTHIKDDHMNLKNSLELFQEAETRRYYAHLEKLYNENKSGYDKTLEAVTIHFEENKEIMEAAQRFDNLDDAGKYFVLFCDKNVDAFTTMRHVYVNNQCVYCSRSVARVHQEALQAGEDHVKNLVKNIEKRLKELNMHYCLLNHVPEIHKKPCAQKRKMLSNLLNGKDTVLLHKLLSADVSWELNRKLDHVPFRVAKHLTDIVEQYKSNVRNDYSGDIPFDMAPLDEIDAIYARLENRIEGYYRKYDKNYLQYVSSPYRSLTKKAKEEIFFNTDILNLEQDIIKYEKENFEKIDPTVFNKNMNQMVDTLRKKISYNAKQYLDKWAASTSIESFAQDITTVLGRNDSDAYVDILKKLNSQYTSVVMSDEYIGEILNIMSTNTMMNDAFIERAMEKIKNISGNALNVSEKEKRDMIRQYTEWHYIESLTSLPKDMLLQLLMFTEGRPKTYRRMHYVLSQKK